MALLTVEVEIKLNSLTYDYWITKGYYIPSYVDNKKRLKTFKKGQLLKVKVADLPPRSNAIVEVMCDLCQIIRKVRFCGGKGLCHKCNIDHQKGINHPRFQKEHKYMSGSDRTQDMYFKRNYGISLDQYNQMLMTQEFRCKICQKNQQFETKRFNVDHDHKTGKVRSLLCTQCNTGLGSFKDSLHLLEIAVQYLKEHENG